MIKEPLLESLTKPCECESDYHTMSCNCKKFDEICIFLCKCAVNDCKNILLQLHFHVT